MPTSKSSLETYYDAYGVEQDKQAYYEDPAFSWLIERGFSASAEPVSLVEFGCGTGRFASQIAAALGDRPFQYQGFDVSQTMVDLTWSVVSRLEADVTKTDGSVQLPVADETVTHFATTFVMDLLSADDQAQLLREADRVLVDSGTVLLASLDAQAVGLARVKALLWRFVHAFVPMRVGGCRPVSLLHMVDSSDLEFVEAHAFDAQGLGVRCVIARKVAR